MNVNERTMDKSETASSFATTCLTLGATDRHEWSFAIATLLRMNRIDIMQSNFDPAQCLF